MTKLTIVLLLLLSALGTFASEAGKKNLCTITINSNQEAELFKKNLSSKDWNFIELTSFAEGPEDKQWMRKACQQKVNCDVLVVSGHFAGTFFGKTNFKLSIQDLEVNSCDQQCDGIFNRPKEVFLLGCNTLASKEKDLRSPEEYMQVLMNDGFSPAQASQVVSFRYSGFGESFKTRMTSVFPKTPRIYGFSSIGPSGSSISPLLTNYLKGTKSEYAFYEKSSEAAKDSKNLKLFQALKNTSLTQSRGGFLNMKSADEKPYCYIRSAEKSNLEKLKYIEDLFESGKAISLISHLEAYIHELKSGPLKPDEQIILNRITQNPKIKRDLLDLLKLNGDIYIALKVQILNTLLDLGIVDAKFVDSGLLQLIDFRHPLRPGVQEMICSANFSFDVPMRIIAEERWSEQSFLQTMLCLRPKNKDVKDRILQIITNPDPIKRGTALWFFYGPSKDLDIDMALAKVLSTDKDVGMRLSASLILLEVASKYPVVQNEIVKAILAENDINVTTNILNIFSKTKLNKTAFALLTAGMAKAPFSQKIAAYVVSHNSAD